MTLENIKQKLSELFDSSESELKESREKLLKIIEKLTDKKESLKEKMLLLGEEDETSEAYEDLEDEYRVVSKLLKKARKQYNEDVTVQDDDNQD